MIPPLPEQKTLITDPEEVPRVLPVAEYSVARALYLGTAWELSVNQATGDATLSMLSEANVNTIVTNVIKRVTIDASRSLQEQLGEMIDRYSHKPFVYVGE